MKTRISQILTYSGTTLFKKKSAQHSRPLPAPCKQNLLVSQFQTLNGNSHIQSTSQKHYSDQGSDTCSMEFPQTSFHRETIFGIAKYVLFSQAKDFLKEIWNLS